MKDIEQKAYGYALKNAVAHKGDANAQKVLQALFNEGLEKSKVKEVMPQIQKVVEEVNNLSLEEKEKEFKKIKDTLQERSEREGLPEIPNTEKGVTMRFSPSPSGGLHIGHAITALLNYLYVKKHGGTFYTRIEDTNPDNILENAYKIIEEDIEWLTQNNTKILIQSDRMDSYYKYIKKLFEKDAIYVCDCNPESFKKLIDSNKACPCRDLDKKEQKSRWEKMLDKDGYKDGEVVIRFKSDLNHKNPALRDFPLARINTNPHPRTKDKYRVWPLMNLAVTVDDIEAKMTHIVRGNDHRTNSERQKMIYKVLGKEKQFPWVEFIGRYKFIGLELSSSTISEGIKNKEYSGWDDPKLPTLQSLKKQGYTPESFYKFVEHIGMSPVDKVMKKEDFYKNLDLFNKKG